MGRRTRKRIFRNQTRGDNKMNKQIEQLEKLYRRSLKIGRMPYAGLCMSIGEYTTDWYQIKFISLFKPERASVFTYWAYDGGAYNDSKFAFTPLRQTLLLLFIEFLKTDYNE